MQEVLLISLVVLLFFGGRKIPELMKGLGKGVRSFKDGMKEIDKDMEANAPYISYIGREETIISHYAGTENANSMSFWDHLDVQRVALMKIVTVAVVFGVAAFFFKEQLFSVILAPKETGFITYRLLNEASL